MAEQCYAYARRMWNAAYPKSPLAYGPVCGPELWAQADDLGYTTSDEPMVKSIVCWDDGGYGHVAWVTKDNGDGTMNISESNWAVDTGPTTRTISVGDRGSKGNYILLGFVKP